MLRSEKLDRFFHLICTDNNSAVPTQIRATPTILLRGVPIPFVAGDAFAWLARVKQWKMNLVMQNMNTVQQQYMKSINKNLVSEGTHFEGFSQAEMNSMSDIFSHFSKNITQENQDSLQQSYVTCNNMGNENIFTPPLEDGSYKLSDNTKVKINPNKLKEMYNNLKQERVKNDEQMKQLNDEFRNQYNN